MVEGVVEVIEFENQLLAPDVLVDSYVVGARALRSRWRDVKFCDIGRVAGLQQLRVEACELNAERRLLHARGRVATDQRTVEPLLFGADRSIGQADARSSCNAVEMVLLQASTG